MSRHGDAICKLYYDKAIKGHFVKNSNNAGKPCGIDYEMKAYVGDTVDDKPHKRNSVRLAIRKVGLCGYKTEGHNIKHNVHIPGYVRTQQARGPAQCRGVQRVHDVSQQTAFR